MTETTQSIEFYGAAWCGDCVRASALLEHYGVEFTYHDVDASDAPISEPYLGGFSSKDWAAGEEQVSGSAESDESRE